MSDHEGELELELEQTLGESEMEEEAEGEGFLGGLLGEEEGEAELEGELEGEGEDFLGDLLGEEESEGEDFLGGLLGEGESESEDFLGGLLGEEESEGEEFLGSILGEQETEEFFGKIGGFFKKALPILKKVAKVAAPIVGTAIGGPIGGTLGKMASSALGEEEGELEEEFEAESEAEVVHEINRSPVTHNSAVAEMMADAASTAHGEGEAEAMVGASTVTVISPADRRALRRILPHLVRGTAILTRILRRRRATRPLVRAVPTVVRRTIRQLKKRAARGLPITRRAAARVAARQVRRVLGSPKASTAAVVRNVKVSRAYRRRRSFGRRRRRMVR